MNTEAIKPDRERKCYMVLLTYGIFLKVERIEAENRMVAAKKVRKIGRSW